MTLKYTSELSGAEPISVRRFPHTHPGLECVVLDLGPGRIEVQVHDGEKVISWSRFSPRDFELLEYVRERLLATGGAIKGEDGQLRYPPEDGSDYRRPLVSTTSIAELMLAVEQGREAGQDAEIGDRLVAALRMLPAFVARYRHADAARDVHELPPPPAPPTPPSPGVALRLSFIHWLFGETG